MLIEDRLARSAATLDEAIARQGAHVPRAASRPERLSPRPMAVVAASVLVVVGLLGIAALARDPQPPNDVAPLASLPPTTPLTTPLTAPAAPPTTEPTDPEEATLRAMLLSLLGVQKPEELELSLATNIPESEVAACMSAAGLPYEQDLSPAEQVAADPRNTMSAIDYASTYGLGVVADRTGELALPIANFSYLASLDDAEREQYELTRAACAGGDDEQRRGYSDALTVSVDLFRSVLAVDPTIVDALTEWKDCMQASGHAFDSPQSMSESFYAKMAAAGGDEELDRLRAEETAVAIANVPCQAAYDAAYRATALRRFGEYRQMLDAAVTSGASPEAQG